MTNENDKMHRDEDTEPKKTLSSKTVKEQELLKKIAYHEAYSAAYKLNLAKILLVKGAKAASRAAVKGGKFVKTKFDEAQEKKSDKSDHKNDK